MNFVNIAMYSFLSLIVIASPAYSQEYDVQFHDEKNYSDAVPSPDEVLGYRLGDRPARYDEIVSYIKTVADKSDRALLETHGSTYEGRQLYHLIISSPENLSRIDEIRANIGKLADPRRIKSRSESNRIIKSEPAVAWMSYAIHGDELSSADAALFVAYRLTAADDPETKKLLAELIIIVDPL
ncbi:MAG: peptidase M14, partial [Candidatus Marinimicrobia bacterium]|nr:peptidase M14 [Candidatus Neomarinimicrobiota bacterium]